MQSDVCDVCDVYTGLIEARVEALTEIDNDRRRESDRMYVSNVLRSEDM